MRTEAIGLRPRIEKGERHSLVERPRRTSQGRFSVVDGQLRRMIPQFGLLSCGDLPPRIRGISSSCSEPAAVLLLMVNLVGGRLGPFALGILSDALAASADPMSLRYALLVCPTFFGWSGCHYPGVANEPARELRE